MNRHDPFHPAAPPAALAAAAALALLACGGGGAQGPDMPDFTGTYEGTWTVLMQAQSLGERREARCRGAVEVTSQTDTSYTATFRVEPGGETSGEISCSDLEGRFVDAGLGSGGLTSFRLEVGDRSGISAITGCQGRALWQGDFSRTPSLPEKARFEAGVRVDVLCGSDGQERTFGSRLTFTGRAE